MPRWSGRSEVMMPASKLKAAIAKVLKDEGYIEDFAVREERRDEGAAHRPEVLRRAGR